MFQVGPWQFVRSYGSRLIINTHQKTLWRYAWGSGGKGLQRNFDWLQKVHTLIPTPRPLHVRQWGPLTSTSESYVPGQPLAPADITLPKIKLIFQALAPLYASTVEVRGEQGAVAIIHGDLTHRNILFGSDGFYFIDGDRGGIAPPEFDVWLLIADSIAHRAGGSSHAEFLQQLWHSSLEDVAYRQGASALYESVPALEVNRAHWPLLWQQFLARCLVHSVRDCVRRGKSLDFLDGLK